MINYKNNVIFSFLSPKMIKAHSERTSVFFYDKRIKGVFIQIAKSSVDIPKFYFSDTTMERIDKMNIESAKPKTLSFLYEKYGNEIGMCFCKESNLSFIYTIGKADIKFLIFSGNKNSTSTIINDNKYVDYSGFNKTVVGSCIINYDLNLLEYQQNNTLGLVNNMLKDEVLKASISGELLNEIKILKNNPDRFDSYNEDLKVKSALSFKAVKMFVFFKTASTIDKNFISEKNFYSASSKQKKPPLGITVIDSNWDSSTSVLNPFGVAGHFRNQPKKNNKNEWYTELIYIDSFMKTGYNRVSGKDKSDNDFA